MTENVRKFLEAVSQNEEEKKEVSALRTKEEVIAYAKGKGFTLTEEDLEQSREGLSDEELDAVAGGDICACVVGGGGPADGDDGWSETCACVIGGDGFYGGDMRCLCAVGGGGEDE